MKKKHLEISSFYKCTKNHDHTLYCFWDMACDRCNCYFSFWAIFCPFTPLRDWKIKFPKKWKNCLEISSLYTCIPKIMIRWCTIPEIWCVMDRWTDGQTETDKKWKSSKLKTTSCKSKLAWPVCTSSMKLKLYQNKIKICITT